MTLLNPIAHETPMRSMDEDTTIFVRRSLINLQGARASLVWMSHEPGILLKMSVVFNKT